ncbi:hypothetical protein [Allocoleopsis franciscana]|uniref:Uncharacterized protein n=1 Tax=Allocoleopsis franciscana PCC 7113 TaxID=1173027 RepID=K9W8J0_9CYAN|nr:hypothetical protein [Allocoleopsis franciscana]AFZ16710.1 hypothetical protein Mic7113_0802 [Allocoleopsis franciscana PCC 7113]
MTQSRVTEEIAQDMTQSGVQIDPLDSPHPIPWNWVLATHAELSASKSSGIRYYRSPSLLSPDGQYAAYSRIQMEGQPELYQSRVTSVVFVENLQTGDLRTITASSPLVNHSLLQDQDADMPGTITILIPISWSKSSDRLLARQFEGLFNTTEISDFAVVWDRRQNLVTTLAPQRVEYDMAVLLGWSQTHSDRILFRAGELGYERWPVWSVDLKGETSLALEDEPRVYGQVMNQVWAGPQARW